MPRVKSHIKESKRRTGFDLTELHEWIDEFEGRDHREFRHTLTDKDIEKIFNFWEKKKEGLGKVAVEEWLEHIIDDYQDTLEIIRKAKKEWKPRVLKEKERRKSRKKKK